jgi:hypothetical protein
MFTRLLLPALLLSTSGLALASNAGQTPMGATPVKTQGGWDWVNCGA